MNLEADMMGDQPHEVLAIGGSQQLAGIRDPGAEPIDPEPPIRVQHYLDDLCVVSHAAIDGAGAVRSMCSPHILASERIG